MTLLAHDPITREPQPPTAHSPVGGSARPVAIDLFAGAGGLSHGLAEAGFDVRLGLDFDPHALRTFQRNHSGRALLADAREVSGRDLLTEAGVHQVDLLAGGPSCQGFSTHGKRIADDPRNFLYVEFMRLVREIKPTTVLIENVKGLLSTGNGAYRREIFGSFKEMGYSIEARVLHAADFGVPQRRHRVFFVASMLGTIPLPEPTHAAPSDARVLSGELLPWVSVSDAISDLPDVGISSTGESMIYEAEPDTEYQRRMRRGSELVWNHHARPLSTLAASIVKHVAPGKGLRSLSMDQLPDRFKTMRRIASGELRKDCTTLYHRLAWDEPSYTITCNFRNVSSGAFTHPALDRSITPREAARLQSFPDSFVFEGSAVPRQIGNAVPPILGRAVGGKVIEHLREKAGA